MFQYLLRPVRFDYLLPLMDLGKPLRVLDVGCGNRSGTLTKQYFPTCVYHGVDRSRDLVSLEELSVMDKFYEIDLDKGNLDNIPEGWFDCVIASHVIEHLRNGTEVTEILCTKVRSGGIFYIETPSERSLTLPSLPGTLNFHDDPTHVGIYSREKIRAILEKNGFEVLRDEIRRSWKRILFFPAHVVYSLIKYGEVRGTVFWDVLGFASLVIGRRTLPD